MADEDKKRDLDWDQLERALGFAGDEFEKLVKEGSSEVSDEALSVRVKTRKDVLAGLGFSLDRVYSILVEYRGFIGVAVEANIPLTNRLILRNESALVSRIKLVCGEDAEMIGIFDDVLKSGVPIDTETLLKAKVVYGKDKEKLRAFADILKKHGREACDALCEAREVYSRNDAQFRDFVRVTEALGAVGCKNLDFASLSYGRNAEMFSSFVEYVLEEIKLDNVKALVEARKVYGNNFAFFQGFLKIARKNVGKDCRGVLKVLIEAKPAYYNNLARFSVFVEILCIEDRNGVSDCEELGKAADVYRDDQSMFEVFAKLAKDGCGGCAALFAAREAYGKDTNKFRIFAEVAEKNPSECRALADARKIYGNNQEMFEGFRSLAGEAGTYFNCQRLAEAAEVYGKDMVMFRIFVDLIRDHGSDACRELVFDQHVYKDNRDMFMVFLDVVKSQGVRGCEDLGFCAHIYGSDVEKLKIVRRYFELTNVSDEKTIKLFIEKYQKEGEDGAREYLSELPSKVKGLISSVIPVEHRKMPEYDYLVKYAFPEGDYSSHEANLKCGDALEHLDGYQYDKTGYPVRLSGLLGYELKQEQSEDMDALGDYQKRLQEIRTFVASRGPNNEALKGAFETKIAGLFEEKALEEFKTIANLDAKEKLVCLLIAEVLRMSKAGKAAKPNDEILDLIVEYKYAFHEDIEAYVRRSADSAKEHTDEVSQHCMLWKELYNIYGENVRHILRTDLFGPVSKGQNYSKILDAYESGLGVKTDDALDPKEEGRIGSTFSNGNIPETARFPVLYKQIYRIFGNNVKFDSDEDKTEFEERLGVILEPLKSDFTLENFRALLPSLFSLRKASGFNLNSKLGELFASDVNRIARELFKYQEVIEVEAKEDQIGGPKDDLVKKTAKMRKIRGYFSKTRETANARMGAYLCIAGDEGMWKNENYFELVLVDEDSCKCVGLVMLLNIESEDGKKYLWFGPNPFEGFLDKVSSEKCYQYLYDTITEFAGENDYDGVVVPSQGGRILGECTNRGGDFPDLIKNSRLRDKQGDLKIVKFERAHQLSQEYSYKSGALIWQKGQKKKGAA